MTIFAPALVGVPPVGLGLYSRGHLADPGPWAWRTGVEWGFVGVEGMDPANGGIAQVLARCDAAVTDALAHSRSGVILDPETRYSDSDIIALARWIRVNCRRVRIGVTSYPSWPGIVRLVQLAPGLFWGSPQLYYDADTNARGWQRWRALFGFRMVPSVAGYVRGPITSEAVAALRSTREGYAQHLESVPRAGGAIVWPNWPMPTYMLDALRARYGGVSALALAPGAALGFLDSWPGLVAVVLAVLVLAFGVVGVRHAL